MPADGGAAVKVAAHELLVDDGDLLRGEPCRARRKGGRLASGMPSVSKYCAPTIW